MLFLSDSPCKTVRAFAGIKLMLYVCLSADKCKMEELIMEKKELMYEGKAKKVYSTEDPDLCIVSYKDDATAFNGEKKKWLSRIVQGSHRFYKIIFSLLYSVKAIRTSYRKQSGRCRSSPCSSHRQRPWSCPWCSEPEQRRYR